MDRVRKVQEGLVMKLTKLGEQQEHGHGAVLQKFQVSGINRSRDMKDLKVACQPVPSHPLIAGALSILCCNLGSDKLVEIWSRRN